MAYGSSGTHKDTAGHYFYEKKKKRDRITHTSSMKGQDTLAGNYYTGGPFIAETIWICNGSTISAECQILDGSIPLTCKFIIAPNVLLNITPVWMPFFLDVNFWASTANVTCTMGGWIP